MPHPIPYLSCNGTCAWTMAFCAQALDDRLEQVLRTINALAEGVEIVMPLQPTFWAKTWGMLHGRYDTPWLINRDIRPD